MRANNVKLGRGEEVFSMSNIIGAAVLLMFLSQLNGQHGRDDSTGMAGKDCSMDEPKASGPPA